MRRVLYKVSLFILMVALIASQGLLVFAGSESYKDISGNWAEPQIIDLVNLGVVEGYEDNTIRPDRLITRAEFATMLYKAINIKEESNNSNIYFMDVKPGDWYYGPVNALKERAIIDGYDDKTFKPAQSITRAEMISMVVRVSKGKLKLTNGIKVFKDVTLNHWAYWNICTATRAGIVAIESDTFSPNEFVNRAEVAYSLDKMLWNQKQDSTVSEEDLTNLIIAYNQTENSKYNNLENDMDNLINQSYGNQISDLNALANKIDVYKKMGISFDRSISLTNASYLGISRDMAKVSFNYEIISKMFLGTRTNIMNQKGLLTYFLKRLDDKWVIYNEDNEILKPIDQTSQLGKINLVWDQVGKPTEQSKSGVVNGLDVVSPTWFNISDSSGNIESRVSQKYVNWAHNNNYKVWALVTNKFDPQLTSDVLRNPSARKKFVDKMMYYVDTYKLDGINVDFENMYKSDKDLFTQLVYELSTPLKTRGKILSVDITIKVNGSSWSDCYDRAALSRVVDYVAVMTYDQHWSTSSESGSVAQLTWVENGVKGLLGEVPKEKLLLGLPFYTREWKETSTDAGIEVTSEALSMSQAKQRIASNGAKMVWDSESGQYYAEYKKDNSTYKIWLEDERSIDLKSQLVNKYQLAGAASWKAGLETSDIWGILKKNLNKA